MHNLFLSLFFTRFLFIACYVIGLVLAVWLVIELIRLARTARLYLEKKLEKDGPSLPGN